MCVYNAAENDMTLLNEEQAEWGLISPMLRYMTGLCKSMYYTCHCKMLTLGCYDGGQWVTASFLVSPSLPCCARTTGSVCGSV